MTLDSKVDGFQNSVVVALKERREEERPGRVVMADLIIPLASETARRADVHFACCQGMCDAAKYRPWPTPFTVLAALPDALQLDKSQWAKPGLGVTATPAQSAIKVCVPSVCACRTLPFVHL